MKIAGRKIEGPNVETIIIPRGDDAPIVFKAEAVLDYSEFDKLCPRPVPPTIMIRGGERRADMDDPIFKERSEQYGMKRIVWMCLKSLQATPDLEYEKVKMGDPETWLLFEDELKDSGFSTVEIARIRQGIFAANCLDEDKLQEARNSFLASQREGHALLSFPNTEQNGTPSGDLANVSASGPQTLK